MDMANHVKKEMLVAIKHPLAYTSFMNLIKLLISNGGIDRKYILKTIFILFLSLITTPLRIYEKLKFGKKLESINIQEPPIFILGHWRSGTTYLHQLMTQDPNFGYVSMFQAMAPEIFLVGQKFLKGEINKFIPKKRRMDNVNVSFDSPEEEEWALANKRPYTSYLTNVFPKELRVVEADSEEIKNEWKNAYMSILKKSSFYFDEKKLVIKNPLNTTRVKLLLEMFPDAKFIHIYRNPYMVYASRRHSLNTLSTDFALQSVKLDEETQDLYLFGCYQSVMQKFFSEKHLIKPENFIEIKYEDFVGNEIVELQKIYEQFHLPNFEQAQEVFQKYLDSHVNYKTNKHSLDEATLSKVYNALKFTIDQWQYSPPN